MKKKFRGQLGYYKIVTTADNSTTLWSEYFQQTCHSTEGAKSETLFNYVNPCQIIPKLQQHNTNILEIGFGIGEGVKTTFTNLGPSINNKLTFVSTELDVDLVKWVIENNCFTHSTLPIFEDLIFYPHPITPYYHAQRNGHHLYILLGDAIQTVKQFSFEHSIKYDAFYQDAFSPDVNSELWTAEWFSTLKILSKPEAILSTYSCAGQVKRNLKLANWRVQKREGFKRKRESLIAFSD
jgi:chorismate dehydratase